LRNPVKGKINYLGFDINSRFDKGFLHNVYPESQYNIRLCAIFEYNWGLFSIRIKNNKFSIDAGLKRKFIRAKTFSVSIRGVVGNLLKNA
jgi:hypothetical protein